MLEKKVLRPFRTFYLETGRQDKIDNPSFKIQ